MAVTVLVAAWGYLVWLAIDFGGDARDGDSAAWAFLALAAVGAVACLFAGLMMVARVMRLLGDSRPPPAAVAQQPGPPEWDRFAPGEPGGADGNPSGGRSADQSGAGQATVRTPYPPTPGGGSHRHRA
ncbi:MAG: hypothetical protein QM638_10185 [Nocardioides sp.]|uniref:hypothetical protein n=1 Tax=Nocardioides sp. TaxID=35761 RepID=UPI0039E666F7